MDARFNDQFWRQFVFRGYEEPAGVSSAQSWVHPGRRVSMNLYIKTTDPDGRVVLFGGGLRQMIEETPHYVRQLSGLRYTGRIESGPTDPGERQGWLRVTPEWLGENSCGQAYVGANPGHIQLNVRWSQCLDLEVFSHELGHALGFFHVDPRLFSRAVMKPWGWQHNSGQYRFTAREIYHARLAYEVGRGQPYCGWPFQVTCTRRWVSSLSLGRPPIVVID